MESACIYNVFLWKVSSLASLPHLFLFIKCFVSMHRQWVNRIRPYDGPDTQQLSEYHFSQHSQILQMGSIPPHLGIVSSYQMLIHKSFDMLFPMHAYFTQSSPYTAQSSSISQFVYVFQIMPSKLCSFLHCVYYTTHASQLFHSSSIPPHPHPPPYTKPPPPIKTCRNKQISLTCNIIQLIINTVRFFTSVVWYMYFQFLRLPTCFVTVQ